MSDTCINGAGSMAGGDYGRVTVNGAGRCDGLLSAETIQVNGTFHCPGILKSGKLSVNGTLRCDGDAKSDHLRVGGRFKCSGSLAAGKVSCSGMLDVGGNVLVDELDVSGSLRIDGGTKLEGTQIKCTGSIKTDGQISADQVRIEGIVTAREIVGDQVVIRPGPFSLSPILHMFSMAISKADLIEATTVELEGVTARTVNGQDVRIGPNCTIENLDCSGTLYIDPSSTVKHLTGSYTR